MKLSLVLLTVFTLVGTILCDINWATLSDHQLSQINPDVFTTITTSQFQSIPFQAIRGFTKEQIQKIPPNVFHSVLPTQLHAMRSEACSGFTPEQMALPGDLCNNFNPRSCFRHIPAASFAGLTSDCVGALTYEMMRSILPAQFAAINPKSIVAFTCNQLGGEIQTPVYSVITPAQIAEFHSDACCFIDERMTLLKDETLAAMTPLCIRNVGVFAFANLTHHQFNLLPAETTHAIDYYHTYYGNHSLWMQLRVDQLAQFSESAWEGFAEVPVLFEQLFFKWGRQLVEALTAPQLKLSFQYKPENSFMKEKLYKHFSGVGGGLYGWNDVKDELHYANWVKILLISEAGFDFSHHFTADVLNQMAGLNSMGIRGIVFGKIAPHSFDRFPASGILSLTMDQVQNMTAEQWNSIPLASLKDNMYALASYLPVEVIPHLAPQTLAAMVDYFYSYDWHCEQIASITAEQIAVFTSDQRESYQQLLTECSYIPVGHAPGSQPHTAPTHVPTIHTPTGNSTGPSPTPSGGADVGAVFAIILGIIAGIQGLMIGYYFYRKRRVAQYQPL